MRGVGPWALIAGACLIGVPAPAGEPAWVSLWAAEVPAATVVAWRDKPAEEWFDGARLEVAAGRAEEATVLMLGGKLGGKMTIESYREVIYPTEYYPDSRRWSSFQGGLTGEFLSGIQAVRPPFLYPAWNALAFETRNLGETVEAEVTEGGLAETLHLRLAADWVSQEGEDVYLEWAQDDGGKWTLAYPRFATRRFSVQMECAAGKWVLAGMVDPWREEAKAGRKVLVFARVESGAAGLGE